MLRCWLHWNICPNLGGSQRGVFKHLKKQTSWNTIQALSILLHLFSIPNQFPTSFESDNFRVKINYFCSSITMASTILQHRIKNIFLLLALTRFTMSRLLRSRYIVAFYSKKKIHSLHIPFVVHEPYFFSSPDGLLAKHTTVPTYAPKWNINNLYFDSSALRNN